MLSQFIRSTEESKITRVEKEKLKTISFQRNQSTRLELSINTNLRMNDIFK